MTCPICCEKTRVIDVTAEEDSTTRRRECTMCGYRFSTIEIDKDMYERVSMHNNHQAYWMDVGNNNCKCSACHSIRYGNTKQAIDRYDLAPYCEKCGAKMTKGIQYDER